jgi:periplasmic copper chaperone A
LSLLRPVRRLTVVLLTLAALVVAGTGVASAHVSVSSDDAAPGGFGKVTFRVPNESDAASTVGLRIQLPTDTPLTSVRAQPVPGWTVALTTVALDPPVKGEGGETIDSAVSVVEYRADAGGGIAPDQFQEFSLSGGPFPDTETLTFNVVQSYSDGTEAAWIEPTVEGQSEPEHPAPVLSLTADQAASTTAPATATDAATGHSHGQVIGRDPAGLALFFSILALLVGGTGAFLGWRAHRRTVSS